MSDIDPADMVQRKQKIVGVFDRTAPAYDQVGPRFFSHFGLRLVELARIRSGAQVLDVATGRGAVLFPALDAVGPGGHVTGIDLSEAMVQGTSQEIRRRKLVNAEVRQMDAEYLQFPDASFDYVLSSFALLFFPQPERALSEMRRVLKPDGLMALTTWDSSGDEQWKWFEQDLYQAFLPPEAEEEPAVVTQSPPPPDLGTPHALELALQAAGFGDIQVFSESVERFYSSEEEWWSALWTNSMRQMLEEIEGAVGPDGLERFRIAVFEKLKTMRQADGIPQLWLALIALATRLPA